MKTIDQLKKKYCIRCILKKEKDCENCVVDQISKYHQIIEALENDVEVYGKTKLMACDYCPFCYEQKRLQGIPMDCSSNVCEVSAILKRQNLDTREML